ncbi:MAG: DUF92 domain-containing protein [Bacillota bacterium]
MTNVLIGYILSMIIGIIAYERKTLSESGVLAAIFIGTLIFAYGGWFAFLFLLVFFVTSAYLNTFNKEKAPANRNTAQVLANGGFAALFAVLYEITGLETYYILIFVSVAVSASDTWSSEIGRLAKHKPRHILTFKPMHIGLSGAVTLLGLLASIAAGIIFGGLSYFAHYNTTLMIYIMVFGFLGSIIDSLLGTIQVKYTDGSMITEIKAKSFERYSGIPWLNNTWVNVFANLFTLGLFYLIVLM